MPEADAMEITIGMGLNAPVDGKKPYMIAKILERLSV